MLDIDVYLSSFREKIEGCVSFYVSSLYKISVHKITSDFFKDVFVECYNEKVRLSNVVSFIPIDFHTLHLIPFDLTQLKNIYLNLSAIAIKLNVAFYVHENRIIKAVLPKLTTTTREVFVKKVKHEQELVNISVRNLRRSVNASIKKDMIFKKIDKDIEMLLIREVQKITDECIAKISVLADKKIILLRNV